MSTPRLIVKDSDGKRVVPLGDEVVTIGRTANNTISIKDNASSRNHCQVSMQEGGWHVQDLGSRNGTQVNKETIASHRLENGDVIQIGKARIAYMTGSATPSEPALKSVPKKRAKASASASAGGDEDPVTEKLRVDRSRLDDDEGGGAEAEAVVLEGLEERYYLVHYAGEQEHTFGIKSAKTTVGRSEGNDVTIRGDDASSCSSKHAELRLDGGRFTLADLGSTNGTKVNGIGVTQHTLKAGDIIEFGRAQFLLKSDSYGEGMIESLKSAGGSGALSEAVTGASVASGSSSGALAFMLPFITLVGAISALIGGLAWHTSRQTLQSQSKVPKIEGNLVAAYSFEELVDGRPVGWAGVAEGVQVVEVGDAPSGKRVLAISQAESSEALPALAVSYDQTLAIKSGLIYAVNARLRHATGTGFAAVRMRWLSSKDAEFQVDDYSKLQPASAGWQKVSEQFTAPASADTLELACVVIGQVEGAQFDDVTLFRSDKAPKPLPELIGSEGKVVVDRAGLVTISGTGGERILTGARLLVKDDSGLVLYDQQLMQIETVEEASDDRLVYSGALRALRGGESLTARVAIERRADGFRLAYTLDGQPSVDGGGTVHVEAATEKLDGAGPLALESRGEFRKLRGAFVRNNVSLMRWQGASRHLGLYLEAPCYLRYESEPPALAVFSPLAGDDQVELSFRLRLNFSQDRQAMKAAFDAAYDDWKAGREGEAFRAYREILKNYPFVDGASAAHEMLGKIEGKAEQELVRLQGEFERARYFDDEAKLVQLVEALKAYIPRFSGMKTEQAAAGLAIKVADAEETARTASDEEKAARLIQRADDFAAAGMEGLAALGYARILERYTKSSHADKAREALAKLGQPKGERLMAIAYGIDIGNSGVKIAKLGVSKSGSELLDCAYFATEGEFGPEWGPRLKAFIESRKLGKISNATVALSGRDMVLDIASFPTAPYDRLAKMVELHVNQFGERHAEPLSYDWGLLQIPSGVRDEMTTLIAMAKDPYLERALTGLKRAGVGVGGFTPGPVAIYNTYVKLAGAPDGMTYLVDIGEKSLSLSILRGSVLLFSRNVQSGLDLFVDPLMGALEIKRSRAIRFLIEEGRVGAGEDEDTLEYKAGRSLAGSAGQLAQMLGSSIKFCQIKTKIARLEVDRYVLSGGGARMRGLAEFLNQHTRQPVELLDTEEDLSSGTLSDEARADYEDGLCFAAAVGAAQIAGREAAFPVQIRSGSMEKVSAFYSQVLVMMLSLVATVVLLAAAGYTAHSRKAAEEARDKQIAELHQQYKDRRAKIVKLDERRELLEGKLAVVLDRVRPGSRYFNTLALIQDVLPDPMWIRDIKLVEKKIGEGDNQRTTYVLELDAVVEESSMTVTTVERLFETALTTSPTVAKVDYLRKGDDSGRSTFVMQIHFRDQGGAR